VEPTRVVVIPNGIDTEEYQPIHAPEVMAQFGIDPNRPYVLFVGRMTRQKGLYYLLQAIPHLDPKLQVVLCAGDADTLAMQREMEDMVQELQSHRDGIVWIPKMVSRQTTIALYSHATIFCCPSIYEPFGIINLEAMACGTPVVGSAVGGINEVVVDGETGFLVDPHLSPWNRRTIRSLPPGSNAGWLTRSTARNDPELCKRMGQGRAASGSNGTTVGAASPSRPTISTAGCARNSFAFPPGSCWPAHFWRWVCMTSVADWRQVNQRLWATP
jgi:starch synthase